MGKRICVGCKKSKKIVGRGLCPTCYEAARRAVKAGHQTWKGLEKMGFAKPLVQSAFRRALAQCRKARPKR